MCEKMNLIKPRWNASHNIPRFARWDLKSLKTIVVKDFLDDVKEGQVTI